MSEDDTLLSVLEIVSDYTGLPTESVSAETPITALGLTDLDVSDLLEDITSEHGVTITAKQFKTFIGVTDIVRAIHDLQ
jgi:hypothetical protein